MSTLPLPPDPATAPATEGQQHDGGHTLTGFVLFLCSESLIFLALFAGYATYRLSSPLWLPAGFEGLELRGPLLYSIVLVSSSLVIVLAERALHRGRMAAFRGWWLLTMVMGAVFLYGQASEWRQLPFGLGSGVFGACFYLLTGFHGLHVLTGLVLMGLMLARASGASGAVGPHTGIAATALFWHFVDVIWVVLFLLIYVWR